MLLSKQLLIAFMTMLAFSFPIATFIFFVASSIYSFATFNLYLAFFYLKLLADLLLHLDFSYTVATIR